MIPCVDDITWGFNQARARVHRSWTLIRNFLNMFQCDALSEYILVVPLQNKRKLSLNAFGLKYIFIFLRTGSKPVSGCWSWKWKTWRTLNVISRLLCGCRCPSVSVTLYCDKLIASFFFFFAHLPILFFFVEICIHRCEELFPSCQPQSIVDMSGAFLGPEIPMDFSSRKRNRISSRKRSVDDRATYLLHSLSR